MERVGLESGKQPKESPHTRQQESEARLAREQLSQVGDDIPVDAATLTETG
jgi:hypothetical protein